MSILDVCKGPYYHKAGHDANLPANIDTSSFVKFVHAGTDVKLNGKAVSYPNTFSYLVDRVTGEVGFITVSGLVQGNNNITFTFKPEETFSFGHVGIAVIHSLGGNDAMLKPFVVFASGSDYSININVDDGSYDRASLLILY